VNSSTSAKSMNMITFQYYKELEIRMVLLLRLSELTGVSLLK
jgi:hypothetical protein